MTAPLLLLPAVGRRGEPVAAAGLTVTADTAALGLAIASHDCDRLVLRITSTTASTLIVRAGDSTAARARVIGDLVIPLPAGQPVYVPGVDQYRFRRRDKTLLLGFGGDVVHVSIEATLCPR